MPFCDIQSYSFVFGLSALGYSSQKQSTMCLVDDASGESMENAIWSYFF